MLGVIYKYYAVRVLDTVILRKSVRGLRRVRSKLYTTSGNFSLTQTSYVGGIIIGMLPYLTWHKYTKLAIAKERGIKIEQETVVGLHPYITRSKENGH